MLNMLSYVYNGVCIVQPQQLRQDHKWYGVNSPQLGPMLSLMGNGMLS